MAVSPADLTAQRLVRAEVLLAGAPLANSCGTPALSFSSLYPFSPTLPLCSSPSLSLSSLHVKLASCSVPLTSFIPQPAASRLESELTFETIPFALLI